MRIDLTRYGVPAIDEHKVPIIPEGLGTTTPHEGTAATAKPATADTIATSKRLLTTPSPREASRQQVKRATTVPDSVAVAKRDSLAKRKRAPVPATPSKRPTR